MLFVKFLHDITVILVMCCSNWTCKLFFFSDGRWTQNNSQLQQNGRCPFGIRGKLWFIYVDFVRRKYTVCYRFFQDWLSIVLPHRWIFV